MIEDSFVRVYLKHTYKFARTSEIPLQEIKVLLAMKILEFYVTQNGKPCVSEVCRKERGLREVREISRNSRWKKTKRVFRRYQGKEIGNAGAQRTNS